MRPLCFVLMPYGVKQAASGSPIDFDRIYRQVIAPAIEAAGMEPIRADGEWAGGLVHKPMFERLLLCDYAVADLTTASANVFYELGVRHAVRPHSTVLIFAEGERVPFDVAPNRGFPYDLDEDGSPVDVAATVARISDALTQAQDPVVDSPIYQLVGDWPELSHSKTDVFREQVRATGELHEALARARETGTDETKVAALRDLEGTFDLRNVDLAVLVDLLLSYRAASAWGDMIRLVGAMSEPLRSQTMIREQYGLALNRDKRSSEAERVLTSLVDERGASPETSGILGRVYKDRCREAEALGQPLEAAAYRKKAIATYLQGFEADWRDAYPGINAVQLIHAADPDDARLDELIPVVTYAVRRKMASGSVDYWDHATLLELAVLAEDGDEALEALGDALATNPEGWMLETTADTLQAIVARGAPPWVADVERSLRSRSSSS